MMFTTLILHWQCVALLSLDVGTSTFGCFDQQPYVPFAVESRLRIADVLAGRITELAGTRGSYRSCWVSEDRELIYCMDGSVIDLRTNGISRGKTLTSFRRFPSGEFRPVLHDQLAAARLAANQYGVTAGQLTLCLEFRAGKIIAVMDATDRIPDDPEGHSLPWRPIGFVAEYDLRASKLESHRVIAAWKGGAPGGFGWVSIERRLVLIPDGPAAPLATYPELYTSRTTPANLNRAPLREVNKFRGLFAKDIGTIRGVSRSGEHAVAYLAKTHLPVEVHARTGKRTPLQSYRSPTSELAGRYMYIGDTLFDHPASESKPVRMYDRKAKKWLSCGETRVLGHSPKGTWVLVRSKDELWLLKPKWPKN